MNSLAPAITNMLVRGKQVSLSPNHAITGPIDRFSAIKSSLPGDARSEEREGGRDSTSHIPWGTGRSPVLVLPST